MRLSIKEAKERIDLSAVWDLAPNPNGTPAPLRGGVVKSPLRVDEKGASFSVTSDLKLFKDHAEPSHKGDVWSFVALSKPEWSKRDIARFLIEKAGGDPDAKDPGYKQKTKTALKDEKQRLREQVADRQKRENYKVESVPAEKLEAWPKGHKQFLSTVYDSGAVDRRILAQERGWPKEWVDELYESSKLTLNKKGEPIFAVERIDDLGKCIFCGTHTRWRPDEGGKAWSYRPNFKWDGREVAALPFQLGFVDAPIWIVCEGQWDATTAYGLLCGFSDTMLIDACCWGIRGVSGVDVFLSVYRNRIRQQRPRILLIPDADKAGSAWTEDRGGKWCFMRRIKEITGVEVSALKLTATEESKDLNDFYKNGGLHSEHLVNMINTMLEV